LSSKVPVAYVEMRAFAHATEDEAKVMEALHNTLPTESIGTVNFGKTSLTGHYGNPIVLFEARIKDRNTTKALLHKISSGLSIMDKQFLDSEIQQHIDKGNLYLRLDKQSAYTNELKLCQIDPIRLRLHFKKHGTEEVVEICREFGLLP
jgi:RNA binding exosome subunit